MSPEERTRSRPPRENAPGEPSPDGGSLDALAQEGAAFAAAANDIIAGALSGNSTEFLSANQQHGGQ